MPRRLSAMDRVPELIQAAVKVFSEKGYRSTQMADVAFEMGVAAGSLYNYVDGKEGLFALCLERMAQGPGFPLEITLPFATPPMDVTLKRLHERICSSPEISVSAAASGPEGPAARLPVAGPGRGGVANGR